MYTIIMSLPFIIAAALAILGGIFAYRRWGLIPAGVAAIVFYFAATFAMGGIARGYRFNLNSVWGSLQGIVSMPQLPTVQAAVPAAPAADFAPTDRNASELDGDPPVTDRIVLRIHDAARSGQPIGGTVHVKAYHPDAPDKPVLDEELPAHRIGATVESPLTGLIYEFRITYGGIPVVTEKIPYYGGVLVRKLHVRTNAFRAVQTSDQGGEQ